VQSWEQIDLTAKVKTVRRKTRPWKAIIALLLAIAAATISFQAREKQGLFADSAVTEIVRHIVWTGTAIAFCAFGCVATYGLAGKVRQLLEPRTGTSHAAIARYALLLIGGFTTLVTTFQLFGIPIGQLVLGGALTSVFVGIAAQQALSNVFAGLVLLFARPFLVGDEIRLRAGALGGQLEGVVTDIGITYVRLHSGGGIVSIPNSQVLNAIVGPVPKDSEDDTSSVQPAASPPLSGSSPLASAGPAPSGGSPLAGSSPLASAGPAPSGGSPLAGSSPLASAGPAPSDISDGNSVMPGGPGQQGPRPPGP
jgi:Mechanosensitive ion channel